MGPLADKRMMRVVVTSHEEEYCGERESERRQCLSVQHGEEGLPDKATFGRQRKRSGGNKN